MGSGAIDGRLDACLRQSSYYHLVKRQSLRARRSLRPTRRFAGRSTSSLAVIRPFKGIRYNSSVVGNSSDFVYPPFDIISPDEAEALRRRNPYNEVNLELTGPDSTRQPGRAVYESTAKLFDGWVRSGVLSAVSSQYPSDREIASSASSSRRSMFRWPRSLGIGNPRCWGLFSTSMWAVKG